MPATQVKINLKVIPQAKTSKVEQATLNDNGNISLKVRVTAPPENGKANEAVIKLLAEHFKVSKSSIDIVSGWTSRQKVVIIQKISLADVLRGSQIKLI